MPQIDNRRLDQVFATSQSRVRLTAADSPADALLRRAAHLPPRDRALIEATLKARLPRRQIARLLNLPPGTVTRRLQRIANRLHDPLVILLLDDRCPLPEDLRQVGIDHFLRGASIRAIAETRRKSPFHIRQMLEHVRGWHRGLHHRPRT